MLDRINELMKEWGENESFNRGNVLPWPHQEAVEKVLDQLQKIIFPGFFEPIPDYLTVTEYQRSILIPTCAALKEQIQRAFLCVDKENVDLSERITLCLAEKLPYIRKKLNEDIEAFFDGDPAASCAEEIICCYPGLYAIMVYRIAHELNLMKVPLIPRMMSEHAHSKTGIDIHPGATIGHYFFIDHGTGIVIGETTIIGNHVKIYQGVTLGGLSLAEGRNLQNVKRHPTIEDDVTIYSNASILGGDTLVKNGSVIGGNVFLSHSVEENQQVAITKPSLRITSTQKEEK